MVAPVVTVWRELIESVPAPPSTVSPVSRRLLAFATNASLPAPPVKLSKVPVTVLSVNDVVVAETVLIAGAPGLLSF